MTIDEAINILKQYVDYDNPDVPDFYTMEEAIKVIIEALEQEPYTDAISRQAVLDCLTATGLKKFDFILDARDKIKNLPPVTPAEKVGRWVPVSERLPEKNMECLVAVGDFNFTQTAMYSNLMGIKNHRIFYQGEFGDDNFEDITQYVNAWMPLPEPYKAESEG